MLKPKTNREELKRHLWRLRKFVQLMQSKPAAVRTACKILSMLRVVVCTTEAPVVVAASAAANHKEISSAIVITEIFRLPYGMCGNVEAFSRKCISPIDPAQPCWDVRCTVHLAPGNLTNENKDIWAKLKGMFYFNIVIAEFIFSKVLLQAHSVLDSYSLLIYEYDIKSEAILLNWWLYYYWYYRLTMGKSEVDRKNNRSHWHLPIRIWE